jgi:hypothetical protein
LLAQNFDQDIVGLSESELDADKALKPFRTYKVIRDSNSIIQNYFSPMSNSVLKRALRACIRDRLSAATKEDLHAQSISIAAQARWISLS